MNKFSIHARVFIDEFKDDYFYQDLPRWKSRLRLNELSFEDSFIKIYSSKPEFRAVFHYRIRIFKDKSLLSIYNKHNLGITHVNNLYLSCKDIGPGLYLEHAFSSIVLANKIGDDFHLNQCVTVGSGRGGIPTIGDKVKIHTHSVVLGDITIGNDVTIAAGSTVVNDVPDGSVVASPKAVIIKKKNES